MDGAALQAVLRGSFIPAFEALTVDLAESWQEQRNASLEVELTEEWREITQKVAEARQGADIGELFGNGPHLLSEHLADVSDLAEQVGDSLGGWSGVARDTCMVDGVWRAVPWSTTRHALVTRTDILAEVGVDLPHTYDDLLEVATRLRDAGAPPVGFIMGENGPSDSSALAYGMLWSFGGQELDESGRVALESEATLAALEYFAELSGLNAEGALDWGHPDNNDAYLSGEIAITQNPSSIFLKAVELGLTLAEHTTHIGLPAGPAGRFQLPEINSLVVFRHSPDPIAALDWIEFVNERSALIERAEKSLAFHAPLVRGLENDPNMPWRRDNRLAGLSSTAAEGRMPGWPLPPSFEAGLVYQNGSIINMFNAVGSGESTPRIAMKAAAEELRRVYET